MSTILTLLAKDFANLRRNRGALILSLVVPMLLIYIMGMVFGINRKDAGPSNIPLAVVNESADPAAVQIVDALRKEKSFQVVTQFTNPDKSTRSLNESDVRTMIRDHNLSYGVIIPADLVSDERVGIHLKILFDPRNDMETRMVNGLLQQVLMPSMSTMLGKSLVTRGEKLLGKARSDQFNQTMANNIAETFGGDPKVILQKIQSGSFGLDRLTSNDSPGQSGNGNGNVNDLMTNLVRIDHEQVVGTDVKNPNATRIVGGYAVMFLLFALSGGSAAFFDEKNTGIFRRLLSAPVTRSQLLWSRFFYGILFGLGQLTTLFIAGQLLYGVDATGHLFNLIIACTCIAAACTAFGMLLSAITRSSTAANSLATLLVITMTATGGAWFPLSIMPQFMQQLAHFSLVYWAMDAFFGVLWAGDSFIKLLPTFGVLIGIAAVIMSIALWRFNRSPLFE